MLGGWWTGQKAMLLPPESDAEAETPHWRTGGGAERAVAVRATSDRTERVSCLDSRLVRFSHHFLTFLFPSSFHFLALSPFLSPSRDSSPAFPRPQPGHTMTRSQSLLTPEPTHIVRQPVTICHVCVSSPRTPPPDGKMADNSSCHVVPCHHAAMAAFQ